MSSVLQESDSVWYLAHGPASAARFGAFYDSRADGEMAARAYSSRTVEVRQNFVPSVSAVPRSKTPEGGRAITTFLLVPGAGSDPSYWRFVVEELAGRGHRGVAIDLPCEDDSAGLDQYASVVADHYPGNGEQPVVVAHSFGGFTGALVCTRIDASELIYVSAMVPHPGERPDQWWTATGCEHAQRSAAVTGGYDADDMDALFYDGVDAQIVTQEIERRQSNTPSQDIWPGDALPSVKTRFIVLRDDRFFPEDFMRGVIADRLKGVIPETAPGGHMAMLSHPTELVDALLNS